MSAWDDLTNAAAALELEPREYFRAGYVGTAPLIAALLRRAAREAVHLPDSQVADIWPAELAVARSVLGRMADIPPQQPAQEQHMAEPMTSVRLSEALDYCTEGDLPVVAVTPHGSYTFAVTALSTDGGRVTLHLHEIERATDRSA